jgi:hypothetical protein
MVTERYRPAMKDDKKIGSILAGFFKGKCAIKTRAGPPKKSEATPQIPPYQSLPKATKICKKSFDNYSGWML